MVSFDDIAAADVLLLVGTNITESNPITGLRVKEAVKKRGATLITIETLEPAIDSISNISNLALHHFTVPATQLRSTILGLLKAVVEQNLIQPSLTQRQPAYVQAVADALQQVSWEARSRHRSSRLHPSETRSTRWQADDA